MAVFPNLSTERGALPIVTTLGVAWAAVLLVRWRRSKATKKTSLASLPLPPGPKPLPVLGNLLQLPQVEPWKEYAKMSEQYGDMMYLDAVGQPIIVLNSLERAADVFDKRGNVFSGRPPLPVLDLMEMSWSFGLMQYGPEYKRHRRPFHQLVNFSALPKYYPMFNEEIMVLLRKLHSSPKNFRDHLQFYFGAVIMRMSYGFDDVDTNKALISDAEILIQAFAAAAIPGRYLVNNIPWLKYIPSWFPGAGWKKHCEYIATVNKRVLHDSFDLVKENLKKGVRSAYPSMAVTLIEELPDEDNEESRALDRVARVGCASGYAAGADTTVSAAMGLLHILAKYPEVQKRMQREIDGVTGGKRLPLMSDRPNLPYVSAVLSEAARWHTVVPLGLAHTASEDVEYNGYFIPKGSFVLCNTWSIMHDPEIYENPMVFNPDRFMKDGKFNTELLDPLTSGVFGYGRRICPGRSLSTDSLFLTTCSLLAVFDVSPPKDEVTGKPLPMGDLEVMSQVIATPLPFDCSITPRSEVHLDLLQ